MPSTMRRRFASENDISGINTAHARCTQPWPSVGLQTRRNESAGGCNAFLSRSRLDRAQRTQSGFCESQLIQNSVGNGNGADVRARLRRSFRFGRGRKSRPLLNQGQQFHMHLNTQRAEYVSAKAEDSTSISKSSPEWTRVWHSLHLKTLPEPYL